MEYKYNIKYIYEEKEECPYGILAVCPYMEEHRYPDYIVFS